MAGSELGSVVNTAKDFLDQEMAVSLLALVGSLAYFAASKLIGDRRPAKAASKVERQFRNVYAIMDEGRRQSLIHYYMEKYECGRGDAMRRAVEDRQRDTNR